MAKSPSSDQRLRQWGDFQTPAELAHEICRYLFSVGCRPRIVVEPTCGEGQFIRAAGRCFPEAQRVYGLEIQAAYVARARQVAGEEPFSAEMEIHQGDFFQHVFPDWIAQDTSGEILVLGNPPWVTNAELTTLDSTNLPAKTNVKQHAGLAALTGKSNFDISEAIIMKLLATFGRHRGYLALLCKNAVIRTLLEDLPRQNAAVADIRAISIDAARHFGATVDASLLFLRLGAQAPEYTCTVYGSLANPVRQSAFGWTGEKFVADLGVYSRWRYLDGVSPFTWRQGLKHDCARVMELTGDAGRYRNGLGEEVDLEPDSVYPLLKSSDLQATKEPRLRVPVTQHKIGEDTAWIEHRFPKLWGYLQRHRAAFDARRSSIYRGKSPYAIFGIGEYSFAPHKVAVSGMYKAATFRLVEPVNGQPVMLDDTCYFLGFDSYDQAAATCAALSSEPAQGFLQSVVFRDAKRPYTKDVLMRLDLTKVAIDGLPPPG